MLSQSTEDRAAAHARRAAHSLEQMPGKIAALIRRAPTCQTLAVAVDAMCAARDRETIRRETGFFLGTLQATWEMMPHSAAGWSLEEWQELFDYAGEVEARCLIAVRED